MRTSVAIPPDAPIVSPASAARDAFGFTPRPMITMSAGSTVSPARTARTRPSSPTSKPSTETPVSTVMPMPSMASWISAPMSGSTWVNGSGAWSTIVVSSPRTTIASAISTPM